MIDISAFNMLLLTVTSWLDRRDREALDYPIAENRLLRRQVSGRASGSPMTTAGNLPARAVRLEPLASCPTSRRQG